MIESLRTVGSLSDKEIFQLKFLSDVKYCKYHLYPEGFDFLSELYLWFENFDDDEKETAKELLNKICFFSEEELLILIKLLYQEKIRRFLFEEIIKIENLPQFSYPLVAERYFDSILNQCLFISLSDGSMIDDFRRLNHIPNKNVIASYKLHYKAQKKIEEKNSNYRYFFLIEDFVGTGTTFIRDEANMEYWSMSKFEKGIINQNFDLKGQIVRFLDYWEEFFSDHKKSIKILFCPYLITDFAFKRIKKMVDFYIDNKSLDLTKDQFILMPQTIINENSNIIKNDIDKKFHSLCEKYYELYTKYNLTKSDSKGGGVKFGFGDCGLSIVKFNNTPNNSIYLIWASIKDENNNYKWVPLFPRNQRHSE